MWAGWREGVCAFPVFCPALSPSCAFTVQTHKKTKSDNGMGAWLGPAQTAGSAAARVCLSAWEADAEVDQNTT